MTQEPVTWASWRNLEATRPGYGSLNAHRHPSADLILAVDHDGRRHILLPIASLEDGFRDTRSRGMSVVPRPLEVEGQPERPFLDVCCTEITGHEAFNVMATGLAELLADGEPAVQALRTTLDRWRRFWGSVAAEGLTPDQVRGLFGELWFLLVWLLPHGPSAVDAWVGPTGSRHDFQWPGVSIEAKTTQSMRGHIHRINGLDQLDPPENGTLSVFSLRVRDEPAASNSLVGVIERITAEGVLDNERLELFESRLAAVGYSPADADRYRDTRYRVVDERLYRVEAGFPRLTLGSLTSGVPAGVERIEYEVNLEVCPELVLAKGPSDFKTPSTSRMLS